MKDPIKNAGGFDGFGPKWRISRGECFGDKPTLSPNFRAQDRPTITDNITGFRTVRNR